MKTFHQVVDAYKYDERRKAKINEIFCHKPCHYSFRQCYGHLYTTGGKSTRHEYFKLSSQEGQLGCKTITFFVKSFKN